MPHLNPLRRARPGAPAPAVDPTENSPAGCGWFDSSHDLRAGLSITEHDSPDRVANVLSLDVWLAWHLAAKAPRPAACASSRS